MIRAKIETGPHAGTEVVKLSRREAQVLKLLCQEGLAGKEIAERLSISPDTVRQYISGIRLGLGLENEKRLLIWGYQHMGAFVGAFEPLGLHEPGCSCDAIYCRAMRVAKEGVEPAA